MAKSTKMKSSPKFTIHNRLLFFYYPREPVSVGKLSKLPLLSGVCSYPGICFVGYSMLRGALSRSRDERKRTDIFFSNSDHVPPPRYEYFLKFHMSRFQPFRLGDYLTLPTDPEINWCFRRRCQCQIRAITGARRNYHSFCIIFR